MAYKLKDRNEKVVYKGQTCELHLVWNWEGMRGCLFGLPPSTSYICIDGKEYLRIDCYSNDDSFSVRPLGEPFKDPNWIVHFHQSDINTIPFMKLLEHLPI